MSEPVLACAGLKKTFAQGDLNVPVLLGVDLAILPGERVAIVGASGSGKSTLLHLMAGLDRPSSGAIRVDGVTLSDMPDTDVTIFRRERVGLIFQFFNLLPTLTAAENVALPLLLNGKRMKDVRERVEALLGVVGLADRSTHRPDELSGGEKQRVAIARTILKQPPILMLDEATSALDSHTEKEIQDELDRVAKDRTTLVIAHRLSTIVHADNIVVLEKGRIVEEGSHASLIANGGLYASMWQRQREAEQARERLAQALTEEAQVIGEGRPNRQPVAAK